MKKQKDIATLEKQFLCECEVIEMRYEYGKEFTGYEKYGIITELSEEELRKNYAPLLLKFEPYILLSRAYGEVRKEFIRNDKKFEMRALRGHAYSIEDEFDEHHPECATRECFAYVYKKIEIDNLNEALMKLPEIQRRRIISHFYKEKTFREIALEEGVGHTKIQRSILSGITNLKKILD